MKSFLINQFNLTSIDTFDADKCTDTLAFLRYIIKRAENQDEKKEIETYIEQITNRCKQLKAA